MIQLREFDLFKNNLQTLQETSKDDGNEKKALYMTESMLPVIDFDKVKNDYIKNLQLLSTPKSNDALFQDECSGDIYFIEFKNGKIQNEIHAIGRKIFDSLLIFTDIIENGVTFTRRNVSYILVYNQAKNKQYVTFRLNQLMKNEVQDSKGFDRFQSRMAAISNTNPDVFGIAKQFERLYFKKVYTYTVEEFEEKFVAVMEHTA